MIAIAFIVFFYGTTISQNCGDIPPQCIDDIEWAMDIGRHSNSEWYSEFDTYTGVHLLSATEEDMRLYWFCKGNVDTDCNDLTIPCNRTCANAPINIADFLGFDVSTGLQAPNTRLSNERVGEITSMLRGVKNYKFFGFSHDYEMAKAIKSASAFPNDLKFYIEIIPSQVSALTNANIQNLLNIWDDLKENIIVIALGNEPIFAGLDFGILPSKLEMVYSYLQNRNGWKHVKVSIPFSAGIFENTYPVSDSTFKSGYRASLTQILQILQTYNGNEPDWTGTYESMLAAQYDSTYYAMNALIENNGIEIYITETGWPSKGGVYGSIAYANTYYKSVTRSMSNVDSKLYQVKIFFFELFDEELKSGGEWEPNFGFYDRWSNTKYSDVNLIAEGANPSQTPTNNPSFNPSQSPSFNPSKNPTQFTLNPTQF
eukprot:504989_1